MCKKNTLLHSILLTSLFLFSPQLSFAVTSIDGQSVITGDDKVIPLINARGELSEAKKAISYLRRGAGMVRFDTEPNLERAAQMHANYIALNGIALHTESEGMKLFTGLDPKDRAVAAGYKSNFVLENFSSGVPSSDSSIRGLFSAIYHRFGFLNPIVNRMGVGVAQNTKSRNESAFVYLLGSSYLNSLCSYKSGKKEGYFIKGSCADEKIFISQRRFDFAKGQVSKRNPKLIVYPYNRQKNVDIAFYNETPDPRPNDSVTGYPISCEFNSAFFKDVNVSSFELFLGRTKIETELMDVSNDPNSRFSQRQFALFPLKPLEFGKTYSAEIHYSVRDRPKRKSWRFTTTLPSNLIVVNKLESDISLSPGITYTLYLSPANSNDVISSILAPKDVFSLSIIDGNTVSIRANTGYSGAYTLEIGSRKIRATVSR